MPEKFAPPPFRRDYVYLSIDERQFLSDLTTAVVEISFVRPDGRQGFTRGTLQPGYFRRPLNEQEKRERTEILAGGKKGVGVFHLWSVDQNDWVSIRKDRILSAQLTGS